MDGPIMMVISQRTHASPKAIRRKTATPFLSLSKKELIFP